ncbi:hypothetical protein INR49_031229 [Caranx melampygus]|nr:hypothetical protein INR49_031229 [Caranx melampygus]
MEKLEDFEGFLKNVDKISELVKDLNSSDITVQQKAMKKADCHIAALDDLCRTKVNKTTINTNQQLQPSNSPQNESPETFMKIMERDAEDRRIKRIAREKRATALKDKGNEAYTQEDYETAVKYYSDGLNELRDMQPLYTNRAQAYIKLGKYKEAISDCEWALKCNERCIKAYVHMGKAYKELKKYNESRHCFEKIMEIEPGRERMVKEYQIQVDLEEERENQETNARQEFDKGEVKARTVPLLLENLSRPGQTPLFYCGGLEILLQAVTDDENQKMLMTCPVATQATIDLVTSEDVAVRKECLALLWMYSQTPRSRHLVMDSLNVQTLVRNLMQCISQPKQQQGNTAVNILENFASEDKYYRYTAKKRFSPQTEHAVSLCECCLDLLRDSDGGVITRGTGVLSTVLPQSSEAVQHAIQRDVVRTMCRLLKKTGQTATKYAIKTLTVCTASSDLARKELVKSDKKLHILRNLLGSSCDEMVSGNAALCLAHCLELEGTASNLLGTDIVLLLLRRTAGDAKMTAVQQNAAIALGKLCRSEPRHLNKLRELHGFEILHSCMKLIT